MMCCITIHVLLLYKVATAYSSLGRVTVEVLRSQILRHTTLGRTPLGE